MYLRISSMITCIINKTKVSDGEILFCACTGTCTGTCFFLITTLLVEHK